MSMMNIQIDKSSFDDLTKFLINAPGNGTRARNSALSSVGFKLKDKFKLAFAAGGAPGWPMAPKRQMTPYIAKNPPSMESGTYKKKPVWQQLGAAPTAKKLWGSLANLAVYSVDKDKGTVEVGFKAGTFGTKIRRTRSGSIKVQNVIGDWAVQLAEWLTEGKKVEITEKQRRYFWAIGLPFRPGTILTMPPRPLIGPVVDANRDNIWQWFYEKFWERFKSY